MKRVMKLRRTKIKIFDFNTILIFIFLYMYITPAYFLYKDPFATLYPIIRYGRCILSIYFFFQCMYRRKYKVGQLYLTIFLFCFILLISSLLGDLNLASWVNITFQIIGCFAFADYYSKRIDSIIKIGFWYFFVVLIVNNILMVLHPLYLFIVHNDLGNQWYYFAASKNQFSMFCFPLLFFSYLAYERKMIGKPILMISILQAAIPPIFALSITSLVSVILFEALMILKEKDIIRSKRLWIAILVVVCAMQLIFTYVFRTELVQHIVIDYLHKDATLSGRAMIWDSAHKLIAKHPLLGMGNGKDGSYYYCIVGDYEQGSIMWAHNTSLDLLTQGGILLIVAFYGIVINSIKKLFRVKGLIEKDNMIFVVMFLIYCIMGYTERFSFRMDLYLILGMAFSFTKAVIAYNE